MSASLGNLLQGVTFSLCHPGEKTDCISFASHKSNLAVMDGMACCRRLWKRFMLLWMFIGLHIFLELVRIDSQELGNLGICLVFIMFTLEERKTASISLYAELTCSDGWHGLPLQTVKRFMLLWYLRVVLIIFLVGKDWSPRTWKPCFRVWCFFIVGLPWGKLILHKFYCK